MRILGADRGAVEHAKRRGDGGRKSKMKTEGLDELLVGGAGPREDDLADGPRLTLRHVVVDRETNLVGELGAGVVLVPHSGERPGEEAGGAHRDGQVRHTAEVAVHARVLVRLAG